jgi:hypothetical protein
MFIQDEEEERPKTNYGQRATSLGIVGKWEDTSIKPLARTLQICLSRLHT